MKLTILTPIIRPAGALEAARSVQLARPHPVEVEHRLLYWHKPVDPSRTQVAPWASAHMRSAPDWFMWLDDDNRMHPALLARLAELVDQHRNAAAFVFSMLRPDFGGILRASPDNMRPGRVDGGQVVLWAPWSTTRAPDWKSGAMGDGEYLQALYRREPDAFVFVDEPLTYHNHQTWSTHAET